MIKQPVRYRSVHVKRGNLFNGADSVFTVDDFLAGFNPGVQTEMILSDSLTDDDFDFGWQHHINGDRIIPICSAQNGFALLLPNVTEDMSSQDFWRSVRQESYL